MIVTLHFNTDGDDSLLWLHDSVQDETVYIRYEYDDANFFIFNTTNITDLTDLIRYMTVEYEASNLKSWLVCVAHEGGLSMEAALAVCTQLYGQKYGNDESPLYDKAQWEAERVGAHVSEE